MKQKRLTKEQVLEVVKLYESKEYTCKDIAKIYDVWPNSIVGLLKRRGFNLKNHKKLSKKYTINEEYFDIINAEDKAYFLGFLYADGCNYETRASIQISLQEEDLGILEELNKKINSNRPIRFCKKAMESRKNQYCLTVSSRYMSKRLAELGCVQKKSLILKFPTEEQVPKYLLRHFIRGYFDGDGHFSITKKKETLKVNSTMGCGFSIVSTEDFCIKLQEIVLKELSIESRLLTRFPERNNSTRTFLLTRKTDVIKFLGWIYEDATIYLERKYQKYRLYIDNNGIYPL